MKGIAHISKKLEWPITYMLRGVDDPVAVQYEVEYLASKRRKSKDGVIFFDHFLKDEWRRYCDDTGRHMSSESKKCLLDISSNEVNDKYLREESFKLWEISIDSDDLEVLKAIDEQDVRCSHAIWARARRQDKTIVSLLIEKIKENPGYWWQAGRYILTEEMTQFLAETIKKVADDNKREESWILPELLSKLNPSKVEELLISCWEKLRTIPEFVQIALYTATPNLISLARKSIQDSDNPKSLFEHYSLNVGIRTKGREGITRLEQLDAIQPYFDLLSDGDLHFLWEEGRKLGWTDYVARYLEPVIEGRDSEFIGRVFKKSSINTSCLDKDLEKGGRINLYHWVDMEKRQGWTRNEIFSALMIWFEKNKGIPALKVAGAVVSDSGGRSEYATLEKAASGLQGACEVLDQIRFEVYSRTLM
ncbi:MAG: hypothetical protein JG718_13955 [Candidatus Thiothrix moscowensis]|nr:hypothetical protein [Candidatus Thiothrix moscowensis]